MKDANFYGFAQGVPRGAVPSARIAAYKVCQPRTGCYDSDILAAFDDAIADGVDMVSISIGGGSSVDFYADSITIGAFHAMERGILTVQAAGNDGLRGVLTSSVAPWMLTVAASSTDRRIVNKTVLGNTTTVVVCDISLSFDLSHFRSCLICCCVWSRVIQLILLKRVAENTLLFTEKGRQGYAMHFVQGELNSPPTYIKCRTMEAFPRRELLHIEFALN